MARVAAASDVSAYAALRAELPTQGLHLQDMPLDDVSIANALAARYREQGIDPSFALASTDDPLADFGGMEAFK